MSALKVTRHPAGNGKCILQATLDAEKSLNALTLEMIRDLAPLLADAQEDDQVAAILLDGAGHKAFCAGGDIRNIYKGMTGEGEPGFCETFFTEEYRLDYAIHTSRKPVIVWGGGIVMGGGLGLMAGASHRVVTESSKIAMPEVSIGLYPDVGGTWFLNRMPGKIGLFLGLTASQLNATDCRYLGLADRFLLNSQRELLLERLCAHAWGAELGELHHGVSTLVRGLERDAMEHQPESQVFRHFHLINELMDHYRLEDQVGALLDLDTQDRWLQKAQAAARHGSPASMVIIRQQLERGRHFSLREVFESELDLSVNCTRAGEMAEGVRALLIDKDGKPDWTFKHIRDVAPDWVARLFESPWPDGRPAIA